MDSGIVEGKDDRILSLMDVSTKLRRIAKLAEDCPAMVFTSLAYHIDLEFLREAYRRTRKDGAPGVDRVSGREYARDLERNLEALLNAFKSGRYRAPPVRRVHIPKGDGRTRPLGIPAFEDKVLQRAVTMVLEAVYEEDFVDGSYGFRPKRSAHDALEALREGIMEMKGGWVIDADITGYFDNIDHGKLREILDQRVRDGVLRRAIDKWLKAGVLEDGSVSYSDSGTPQGGVVSPLLANIYLHEVLDTWFADVVQPRMKGRSFLVRYADDFLLAFECREDAERVFKVLPKRFAKYGLTIHPEKSHMVCFTRPALRSAGKGRGSDGAPPGTFDLLGFTHYWAKSRKGNWVVKRKTMAKRFRRGLRQLHEWCQAHRHTPLEAQWRALTQKLRGHFTYYGITGNYTSLSRFHWFATRIWKRSLDRRSQRGYLPWDKFKRLLVRFPLPMARCYRSTIPCSEAWARGAGCGSSARPDL
jgi:RNA-directed DNA polymerase